uniref:Neur_chan_LBD domain-containing protein n=1 Tax=Panagrellus redivivus TaxID=6233 RepID=A0A7E4V7A9_PANRE
MNTILKCYVSRVWDQWLLRGVCFDITFDDYVEIGSEIDSTWAVSCTQDYFLTVYSSHPRIQPQMPKVNMLKTDCLELFPSTCDAGPLPGVSCPFPVLFIHVKY